MFEIMVYFKALIVQSLTFMTKLNSQFLTQNNDSLVTIKSSRVLVLALKSQIKRQTN